MSNPETAMPEDLQGRLTRIRNIALIAGALVAVVAVVGLFVDRERFFRSYMIAFLFWASLSLGCLGMLLLHQLTKGQWGFVIRRLLAAGARTLPLVGLLFLPILLGLHELYEWTHEEAVASDPILQAKTLYLNVPFFIARNVVYFAIWIWLAFAATRDEYLLDETGDLAYARTAQRRAPFGLILYILTVTFAVIDWSMSMEPHWFSSIHGLIYIGRQLLGGVALSLLVLALIYRRPPLAPLLSSRVVNDLGNLLLAALISWVYFALIQYIVIWSSNLPEEVIWYVRRLNGGWEWVAALLVLIGFVVPFLLLIFQQGRREVRWLAAISAMLLIAQLIDSYWQVIPAFHPAEFSLHWLDIVLPAAFGGLWIGLYFWQLLAHALVSYNHPDLIAMEEQYEHA